MNFVSVDINPIISFVKNAFSSVINQLDNIYLISGSNFFSLLDLLLAILVLGAILPVVLVTIKNWGSGNISDYQGRERYLSRRTESREYNKRMNEIDKKFKR